MVFDRLRGIERENLPLSRRQTVDDQETEAQENILSSVDRKTPKEHQIGEWFSQERLITRNSIVNGPGLLQNNQRSSHSMKYGWNN